MRRRATVTFSDKNGEVHHNQIWVQRLKDTDIQGNSVILKLYRDEDNQAVLTEDNDGTPQYQVSLPVEEGPYAYVPVNAMKALIATNSVRTNETNETWVKITLDPISPSLGMFNKYEPTKDI